MKKARLILSGLAVLAVVGTGLAFKAKSSTNVIFCNDENNKCLDKHTFITTSGSGNVISDPCGDGSYGTSASSSTSCPLSTVGITFRETTVD